MAGSAVRSKIITVTVAYLMANAQAIFLSQSAVVDQNHDDDELRRTLESRCQFHMLPYEHFVVRQITYYTVQN